MSGRKDNGALVAGHSKAIDSQKKLNNDDEPDEPGTSFLAGASTYRSEDGDGQTYYMGQMSNRAISTHRDNHTEEEEGEGGRYAEDEFAEEIQGELPTVNDYGARGYSGPNKRSNIITSKDPRGELLPQETPRGDLQLRNQFDDIVKEDTDAAMSIFSSNASFEKKAIALYFLFLILFSIFLNIVEFTYFSDTPCDVEKALLVENDGTKSWVHENLNFVYGMMYMLLVHKVLVKLGMINFMWEGLLSKRDSLGIPSFLLPVIVLGSLPTFMITNYIYDFNVCKKRNDMFSLDDGLTSAAAFGIINLTLYTLLFLLCLFFPTFKIKKRAVKFVRTFVYLLFALYMTAQLFFGLIVVGDVLSEEFVAPLTMDLIVFCIALAMFVLRHTLFKN